jgi:hypothetical protein
MASTEAGMHLLKMRPEWLDDAWQARTNEGQRWLEFCIQGWVDELSHADHLERENPEEDIHDQ